MDNDNKSRIIEQSAQMFFRYGIRSITMDEIAESLGISKRTLYESFPNKEELLKQCIEQKHIENVALRDTFLAEFPGDPLEVISRHFRNVLLTLNEIHPNFFNDLKKYHSRLWSQHIVSREEENIGFTRLMIEKGKKAGIFRVNVDTEILSKMAHTIMQQITLGAIFPEDRFPRAEVARQVMMNFIRGLATPEGLKQIDEMF